MTTRITLRLVLVLVLVLALVLVRHRLLLHPSDVDAHPSRQANPSSSLVPAFLFCATTSSMTPSSARLLSSTVFPRQAPARPSSTGTRHS